MKLYQSNAASNLHYFVNEDGFLMCYHFKYEQFYLSVTAKLENVINGTKLRTDIEVEGKDGVYRIVPTDLENV